MVRKKNYDIFLIEPMLDKKKREGEESRTKVGVQGTKHIKRLQCFDDTLLFHMNQNKKKKIYGLKQKEFITFQK